MTMKELINKVKEQNGNVNFTHKDLTWYIVGRLDDLAKTSVDKSLFWKITLFTTNS